MRRASCEGVVLEKARVAVRREVVSGEGRRRRKDILGGGWGVVVCVWRVDDAVLALDEWKGSTLRLCDCDVDG